MHLLHIQYLYIVIYEYIHLRCRCTCLRMGFRIIEYPDIHSAKTRIEQIPFFFVKYVQMAQNYGIMLEILMQYLYKRGMKL